MAPPRIVHSEPPSTPLLLGEHATSYQLGGAFAFVRTDADPLDLDPAHLGPYLDGGTFVPSASASVLGINTVVFRLQLREPTSESPVAWALHASKAVPAMALYIPQSDGTYRTIRSGMSVPYAQRPFPAIDPVIPIPQGALDGRPIYLAVRVVNEQRLPVIARVHDVVDGESTALSLASSFAGFFLAFALSSLLVYASVRSRASLHYAVLMIAGLVMVLVVQGWPWKFLWPMLSVNWRIATYLALLLTFVATINFARVFLSLPRSLPRIDRLLRISFWIAILAWALFGMAPNSVAVAAWMLLATDGFFFVMLAAAIVGHERGVMPARYAVLAFAGICVASTLGASAMTGSWAAWSGAADWAIAIGIAWQALFLSLGLAEHLGRLDRERALLSKENKSLESLATHDAVTGIPNRRAFDDRLFSEWRRALRNGREIAVLMIDIDHFKAYNDAFGHIAGDECLRRIGKALEGCMLRSGDFVARYGGEEFVAIVPDITITEARALAEVMRNRTADLHIRVPGTRTVTISVGIAVGVATAVADPMQLVHLADEALYAAKTAGRDRTVARAVAAAG